MYDIRSLLEGMGSLFGNDWKVKIIMANTCTLLHVPDISVGPRIRRVINAVVMKLTVRNGTLLIYSYFIFLSFFYSFFFACYCQVCFVFLKMLT